MSNAEELRHLPPPFNATILTLYPEMFPGVLGHSLPGTALKNGLWTLDTLNPREFGEGKHRKVDDTPYGGGAGLVMKPDVMGRSIAAAHAAQPQNCLVYLTPRGAPLSQSLAKELAAEDGLTLICGRFEGMDERVVEHYQPLEISIGDYILFGGEVAAMVLLESVLRNIPAILGNPDTLHQESFDFNENCALLLEYPHYTKPPFWEGRSVPEVLTSGNHAAIEAWRQNKAEEDTKQRRPDLWERFGDRKSK